MSLAYRHPFTESWFIPADGEWGNRAAWRSFPPHAGVDYNIVGGSNGKTIRAIADGYIRGKGWHTNYGNRVYIEHDDGMWSHYAHMSDPSSKNNGDRVTLGTPIGLIGSTGASTGAHLHLEVATSQSRLHSGNTSIDPITWINTNPGTTTPIPEAEEPTMRTIYNTQNTNDDTRRAVVGEFSFQVISSWYSIGQQRLFGVENVNQAEWDATKVLVNLRRTAAGMTALP